MNLSAGTCEFVGRRRNAGNDARGNHATWEPAKPAAHTTDRRQSPTSRADSATAIPMRRGSLGGVTGNPAPIPAPSSPVSGHQEPSTLHESREKSLDVVKDAENQYPRQGSNDQRLPAEKTERRDQATSDPTSLTDEPQKLRRKSIRRRSRTSPPASRPCPRRPSPPCSRSSAGSPGDRDWCPAANPPPVPPRLHTELPSPRGMPMQRECSAGQHDSCEPLSLRPRQAAARLGVSVSTLNRLTRAGRIQSITFGNIVLYRVESLRKWLESQEA